MISTEIFTPFIKSKICEIDRVLEYRKMLLHALQNKDVDHMDEENEYEFDTTLLQYLAQSQHEVEPNEFIKDVCFNSLIHPTKLKEALDIALQNLDQKVGFYVIDPFDAMKVTLEKVSWLDIH